MLLGALLGYLLFWSGSIWTSIWAHFINNGMGVLMAYLVQKNIVSAEIDNMQLPGNEYMGIFVSVIVISGLLYWVYQNKTPDIERGYL